MMDRRNKTQLFLLIWMACAAMNTSMAQPTIQLPEGLPEIGVHHYNYHAPLKPYHLRDTSGTEIVWDLSKLKCSPPVLMSDSVLPVANAYEDSIPEGTVIVLHRAFGDRRHYLALEKDELLEMGTYAPYFEEREHYLQPFTLWYSGSGYGHYSEQYSPITEGVMTRREIVAQGTMITSFGRFADLLLLQVWPDRDERSEHFELVDPENIMLPLALFWFNGDVQLFERVGYESKLD